MKDFICGIHAVSEALTKNPEQVAALYQQQGIANPKVRKLVAQANAAGIRVSDIGKKQLEKMKLDVAHQGIVAELKPVVTQSLADVLAQVEQQAEPGLLVLVDCINSPHNLGAILRSAAAAGADAVIMPKDKSVPLTAAVRKVAAGAVESVACVAVTNLARAIEQIQEAGFWVLGAAMESGESIFSTDLKGPTALVFGNESKGLRPLTQKHCDSFVHIPMTDKIESLNVAQAATVCLFEAFRQRH